MECGIIGLPNIGKSLFFNLLSNNNVLTKNYPFCTIYPNISNIDIFDKKLIKISKILKINKYKFNNIKLIDIAGIIKNSYKGKGLGNMFLSYIRNSKILINILRLFYNNKIINVNKNIIDPIYEKKIIFNELLNKDIEILNKYIYKNKIYNKKINKIFFYFKKKNINDIKKICNDENNIIKKFNFLSLKPIIYICNINENTKKDEINLIKNYFYEKKEKNYFLNIKKIYKNKNLKKNKLIINNLTKKIFKKLNFNTFYTIDKKKKIICSWKIKKNTYIYKASNIIHSTFSKRFIKAEVIHYNDLIKNKIYIKNLIKIKGKKYIIQNRDILYFILKKNIF
ncbi:MAG: DUF933 domain-containing protein [Candidatus Shikimatogenerans bostrichidophilus]|nr:MAG: DUF933 domain-containing protein [Candidatus Shikimatogenerans bostrichidophilus]